MTKTVKILPTWDPAAYAEMVQNVVFNYRHTNRPPRKFLFENTVDVLKSGGYALADGREVRTVSCNRLLTCSELSCVFFNM